MLKNIKKPTYYWKIPVFSEKFTPQHFSDRSRGGVIINLVQFAKQKKWYH